MSSILAVSGSGLGFPSWGRSYWQDPNDGELICLYASGTAEVDYITSTDGGATWAAPTFAFPIDDFSTHNNFDTSMDRAGNVHCVHRFNGSGCYSIFGKVSPSGGWAPSGVVARGFFVCRATVAARDFNGAIEVYDTKLALFGDPTSPPAARIVAVDSTSTVNSWYVNSPFAGLPVSNGQVSAVNVGPNGGFPIPTNGGEFGSLGVPFAVDGSGIKYRETAFGSWSDSLSFPGVIIIDPNASELTDDKRKGHVGDVTFGPNMTWCRSYIGVVNPVLTTVGGPGSFELYTTAAEPFEDGQFFGRVDSAAGASGIFIGTRRLNSDNLPFKTLINDIPGAATQISGGVPVDISYYNEPDKLYFYFLQRRQNGDQTIFRFKSTVENQFGGDTSSLTRYSFDMNDKDDGIVSWADVSLGNAGAGSNSLQKVVHWHGFKASRSPVAGGSGIGRVETLATIGRGVTNGSGDLNSGLYIWRFPDSLAAIPSSKLATFVTEHTADSGNTFVGIESFSGITDPGNLFDGDTSTSGLISNGDDITLEFSKPLTFNRLEVLWNSPPATFHGIVVDSSFDNVTYNNIFTIPSGQPGASPSLIKSSAEYDFTNPSGTFVNLDMDGFAGKYVRISFDGADATPRDVREIKLYGAHSTKGFISTSGWDSQILNTTRENFANVTGIPSGWRTSGDWDWFVDNGSHESGVFLGDPIGTGDFSAMRTFRSAPPGTSGVLEVDVNLASFENRQVVFALKWALQVSIADAVLPTDPRDDYLFLEVETEDGTIIDKTNDILAAMPVTPWDWTNVAITIDNPGLNIIRWTFRRGSKPAGDSPPGQEAAVWIDNVQGLDHKVNSPNQETMFYGFVLGAPTIIDETINSYVEGNEPKSNTVNAYMLPLSGLPTESFYAYHAGEFATTGNFYGYISALQEFGKTYGYTEGFLDTPSEVVNAYIFTSGAFDILYGHLQNRLNDTINGFLMAPSGAFDSINAYIATPEFLAVNGYVKVTENETVQVNAYLKANGFGDQINGYMFASGLNHQSYGYLNADGVVGKFNAYLRSAQQTDVGGYIEGHTDVSGVINSWMSGIAAISDALNGYLPAISGDITENINGYIEALELTDGSINAHIVGFGGSGQCSFPVPNPSFVLSPTGNFFN